MTSIRRQLVVPVGPDLAFSVFVDEISAWWPTGEGSGGLGIGGFISVRDGSVVEIGSDDTESVWGSVLDWDPPRRLRLTWQPGEAAASEVEVRFTEIVDGQTLVTLEQAFGQPPHRGTGPDPGWPAILSRYADLAGQSGAPASGGPVWLALLHTPGPAVGAGDRIFGHPDFPEHLAFLRGLRDEGLLVAAGPIDDSGEGMAVVRLPDAAGVAELVRRAQDDDLSVARGVLLVRVRPWHVTITA